MHLLRFDSLSAWAQAAAERLCDKLQQQPALRLCLPSGNTPIPLYAALVDAVRRRQLSFRDAQIFALDEYGGLAADDPGRCVNMLRHHLVDRIDLPPAQFHFLDTLRPDLAAVCAEFEERLAGGLALTLLGIGLNGHLGLNEPGSPADSRTRRVELHPESTHAARSYVKGSQLPTWGATIGMLELLASQEVWLLASGPTKAAIVERLIKGQGPGAAPTPDASLPASLLLSHPRCWLWVDPAASKNL